MRLSSMVLMAAAIVLSCSDAATNSEQTKLAAEKRMESVHQNRLLTQSDGVEDSDEYGKNSRDDDDDDDKFVGKSSWSERARFRYWYYVLGRDPDDVYRNFFDGVDRSVVLKNPAYQIWRRYKAYYEEKTVASYKGNGIWLSNEGISSAINVKIIGNQDLISAVCITGSER
ncbi:hypothetical protein PsorP6_009524 [Peronosclerospora sorghi]|uniref:Uncharacterized protein n=1 Tax=Peronosclerospora sorghi TaxID=230839 RepID=A0ACC0VZ62_9STRA|nr:hypothetical protein PsorP6_009524 [Peronosclerospora sorghi]